MKLLENVIWWIFGGLLAAFEYFTAGLVCCLTIIGLPFGIQCFKLAQYILAPFSFDVVDSGTSVLGCVGNVLWCIFFGLPIALTHLFFGVLLCITIIGIPFGKKHFKLAGLAFAPFGREII